MENPQFVYVPYIGTTPEKLWQRQYWFGMAIESDWRLGSSVV